LQTGFCLIRNYVIKILFAIKKNYWLNLILLFVKSTRLRSSFLATVEKRVIKILSRRFEEADRFLIINLLYLGDLIFSLPLLAEIKKQRPGLKLDIIANSNFTGLIKGAKFLDAVYSFDKRNSLLESLQFARKIREKNYPVSLNIHGSWRSSLLQFLSCRDYRAGYSRFGQKFFLDYSRKWQPGDRHMADYYLEWIDFLDLEIPDHPELPEVEIPVQALEKLADKLKNAGFWIENRSQPGRYVVLNSGGSWESKRWPSDNFVRLVRLFLENTSYNIVLSGSSADRARNERIRAGIRAKLRNKESNRVWNAAARTTIPELLALVSRAELVVSGDTGPAHVAALAGTRVISLFGPSDEIMYRPYNFNQSRVIKHEELSCRPCGEKSCPLGHHRCLREISPARVWSAIKDLAGLGL